MGKSEIKSKNWLVLPAFVPNDAARVQFRNQFGYEPHIIFRRGGWVYVGPIWPTFCNPPEKDAIGDLYQTRRKEDG